MCDDDPYSFVVRDGSNRLVGIDSALWGFHKFVRAGHMPMASQLNLMRFYKNISLFSAESVMPFNLSKTYKSYTELARDADNFIDLPGNNGISKMQILEPFSHTVRVYKSLQDEEYILRRDIFPLVQNLVLRYVPEMRDDVCLMALSTFLGRRDYKEYHIRGTIDFMKLSKGVLSDLVTILCSEEFKAKIAAVPVGQKMPKKPEEAMNTWHSITGVFDSSLARNVKGFYSYEHFWKSKVTLDTLNKFIISRPDLFTKKTKPNTVRLFEDGEERFVFVNELVVALNRKNTFEENNEKMISVQSEFLERLPQIQFIRTPIGRCRTRAIPFFSAKNYNVILATDALVDYLHLLIERENFQISTSDSIKLALQNIEKTFATKTKLRCVDFEWYNHLDINVQGSLKQNTNSREVTACARRSVLNFPLPDQFDLEEVNKAISYTGITAVFPGIEEYAPVAFEYVNQQRNASEKVHLADFFSALEICQMLAIMKMAPKLREFLHENTSCGLIIGLTCHDCPKIERIPNTARPVLLDELDGRAEAAETVITPEVPEAPEEQKVADVPTSATVKKDKNMKGKRVTFSDVISVINNPQKHSTSTCAKCLRTSERCNKYKEDLRQEEKKNKQLAKTNKKELEEKDRKIRQLENDNDEKKRTIEKKNKMIRQLENSNDDQKRTIVEKDKKIEELMAQIAALQLAQQSPEAVISTPERVELTQEMKDVLFDFQTKRNSILNENPIPEVTRKVHQLKIKASNSNDKLRADIELKRFGRNYQMYMDALEENISRIQGNFNVTPSDLLPVPDFPTLSDGFSAAYERIVIKPEEEEEEEFVVEFDDAEEENECQICSDSKEPSDETLKCPHCPETYHMQCILTWIAVQSTCPNCRGAFVNPFEFPALS